MIRNALYTAMLLSHESVYNNVKLLLFVIYNDDYLLSELIGQYMNFMSVHECLRFMFKSVSYEVLKSVLRF